MEMLKSKLIPDVKTFSGKECQGQDFCIQLNGMIMSFTVSS